MRFTLLQRVAGAVLLATACVAAQAADPSMNEAARLALRIGQYERVVQLTSEIARTEPGSALNWYRMAIAAARSNDPALASDALSRAERADPTLKFASTPQRVQKLRADIDRALEAAAKAEADVPEATASAAAPARPQAAEVTPEVDPAALAAVAGLSQQIQGMQQTLDRRLDGLSRGISAVNANQAVAVKAANWERAAWICGMLLAVLACAGLIAVFMERAAKARREGDLRNLAQLPLPDLIAATRDVAALLAQRLERHGHKETEVFVQLSRCLPSLERETGRARVPLDALTDGAVLADTAQALQPRAKVLGHSDPGELHRQVAARAVESARQQKLAA